MRILDQQGNEMEAPDLALGRLVPETMLIAHHEAKPAIARKTRLEEKAIGLRPGDKLVKRVVEQEYVPPVAAWDEVEQILRYVPYTDEELAEIAEREADAEKSRLEAERRRAAMEALPGKVNDLEEAAAELGLVADEAATMGAVNASDIVDIQEAIAEVGVMVAELIDGREA